MGCDIHMYVEYKKKDKWLNGDYFKINHDRYEDDPEFERIELFGSRNYQLFSTLAGVRDYSGIVVPVSKPKGVPKDMDEYTKKEYDYWKCDAHTASWLTLKELKEYQSNNPKMHYQGLISIEQQEELDKGIIPREWCQGTNIEGYARREWSEDNKELIPLIEKLQKRAHELLKYLWQEYDDKNDENIRIVFWFDN